MIDGRRIGEGNKAEVFGMYTIISNKHELLITIILISAVSHVV